MAQDGNVEVTAAAPPTGTDARSIAELRTSIAQTRAQIATTVNAIDLSVSTAVEAFLPDGHGGTLGSNARSLARNLASASAFRMLARRVGTPGRPASRIALLTALGVAAGFWIWLRRTRS